MTVRPTRSLNLLIFVNESDGDLVFKLDMGATVATQGLTLVIDGEEFILKDADRIKGDKTQWKWLNRSLILTSKLK